jgi:16S rRNA processing protein RimM
MWNILPVWSIVTDDGKEVLFPAEASFIEGFDLEGERIHIAPPEGLLDIYLGGDEQA